ncbi:MAG: DUF3301 domain-containing protein [Gammaproteobacteria bacterium]|nr:DUF3301 domain-containing protein [Gammaproteobacteria bacterium]
MEDLLFIILILIVIWYWWDTLQCNEIALAVCQQKCAKVGLQLLDATVSRQRTWLRRGNNGGLQICRLYSFEYDDLSARLQATDMQTTDSALAEFGARKSGYIVLIGKQVVETSMPHENTGRQVN